MPCVQGEWQGFITLDGRRMTFARRPGVVDFLERAAQMYEVVLFTAASQVRLPPRGLYPEGFAMDHGSVSVSGPAKK